MKAVMNQRWRDWGNRGEGGPRSVSRFQTKEPGAARLRGGRCVRGRGGLGGGHTERSKEKPSGICSKEKRWWVFKQTHSLSGPKSSEVCFPLKS